METRTYKTKTTVLISGPDLAGGLPPQKNGSNHPRCWFFFCVATRNWVGLKLRGEDEEIEAPVLLKTWDFGGQREYYDTWIGKF